MLGKPADNVMIIGAAGGHEILASLYYKAAHIDAIELNPATYKLVTEDYADYDRPRRRNRASTTSTATAGRSWPTGQEYDLIWYPAPDSYSATNASTAGAFVLSESYLYTTEAIKDSLDHLAPTGSWRRSSARSTSPRSPTARPATWTRRARRSRRWASRTRRPTSSSRPAAARLSTVLVKKTPFTREEIERFTSSGAQVPDTELRYTPDDARRPEDRRRAGAHRSRASMRRWRPTRTTSSAIDDNGPFFWHFAPFGKVVREYRDSINGASPTARTRSGERVLVLLLVIATLMAAVFLLLPFVAMRQTWTTLPRKATSALYFAALGLGFMFFEITLIQRLMLFLGFPTYSLTVTLASLLIFTGVGALLSARVQARHRLGPPRSWLPSSSCSAPPTCSCCRRSPTRC